MLYCIYIISQKFVNSKILYVFLKKSLLLTKPAFILSKVQQKQYKLDFFLLCNITVFYLNIYLKCHLFL